ncbi:hypothetical protein D3C85_1634800 [compost metagenome]
MIHDIFCSPMCISRGSSIRDAFFQAIRIRTTGFTVINITVGIEIDMRIGPLWSYVDAMSETDIVPPVDFHKKFSSANMDP